MRLEGKELDKGLQKVGRLPCVRIKMNKHDMFIHIILILSEFFMVTDKTPETSVAENEDKPETPVIKAILLTTHCKKK